MIKIQNNLATREPIPAFLIGLTPDSLADLSWTDPSLGVSDCAWWPEVDQSPALGQYERYGDETLTVQPENQRVIVTRAVVPWTAEEIEADMSVRAEAAAALIASKIDALWSAADRYVSGYISGVAIGILTIGVIQAKPKCVAVSEWSHMVWAEYYVRKAQVTATSTDNHDFSMFGPIPYSIPELQAEVGV